MISASVCLCVSRFSVRQSVSRLFSQPVSQSVTTVRTPGAYDHVHATNALGAQLAPSNLHAAFETLQKAFVVGKKSGACDVMICLLSCLAACRSFCLLASSATAHNRKRLLDFLCEPRESHHFSTGVCPGCERPSWIF